jgi:hypothetical protein
MTTVTAKLGSDCQTCPSTCSVHFAVPYTDVSISYYTCFRRLK